MYTGLFVQPRFEWNYITVFSSSFHYSPQIPISPRSSKMVSNISGDSFTSIFPESWGRFSRNSRKLSSWMRMSLVVRRLFMDDWQVPELCSNGSCLILLGGKGNLDIWKKNLPSQLGSLIVQKYVNKSLLANQRGGWVFYSWDHFLFSGKMNRVFCLDWSYMKHEYQENSLKL